MTDACIRRAKSALNIDSVIVPVSDIGKEKPIMTV